MNTTYRNITAALITSILMAFALSPPAQADPRARVFPPGSHPFGKTYGEWSAEHWKWVYSLPADHHPLFDTAGCRKGQTGKVWFLGGTYTAEPVSDTEVIGIADRHCRVPFGKALFFPLIDAECATAEGNGTTRAELRACAVGLVDHATGLALEIDGVPVNHLENFRVRSPLFVWGPLPANNVLQATGIDLPAGTTSRSVSDGYFVMVAPLAPGHHTIHFEGAFVFTEEADGFNFTFRLDITYNITVAKRHGDDDDDDDDDDDRRHPHRD